jgi:hypothetical protein
MDRDSQSKPTPAREVLDCRGLAVLLATIARSDTECLIPSALVVQAQVALAEGDGNLAHWLNDAVVKICDQRRIFDREPDADAALFRVLPLHAAVGR